MRISVSQAAMLAATGAFAVCSAAMVNHAPAQQGKSINKVSSENDSATLDKLIERVRHAGEVGLANLNGGGTRDISGSGPCWTYTTTADFNQGFLFNVRPEPDATGEVCLTLNPQPRAWPFIGVACSLRDSIVRIAVQNMPLYGINEGDVIGEYLTRPNGLQGNPSRTTVDAYGNIWVGNRNEASPVAGVQRGSVARVGLVLGGTRVDALGNPDPTGNYLQGPFDYCTCEDRDGDGLIKTSRGYPHTTGSPNADYVNTILPWTNAASADTAGGVTTAEDECITAYVRTAGTYVRHVSIAPNGDPWIGSSPVGFSGNGVFERIDGATAQPILGSAIAPTPYCAGYGGFVDKNGTIWSASLSTSILRLDNPPPGVPAQTCINVPNYGIGIDPITNHVWTNTGSTIYEIDPSLNAVINSYPNGAPPGFTQGMTIDTNSTIWVAHSSASPSVGRILTNGTLIGNVNLTANPPGAPALHPSGVAVDNNGFVWATNRSSHNVMRIDPSVGVVGAVDLVVDLGTNPPSGPYNYSDMTGSVLMEAVAPQGSWTVVHDGGKPNCDWGTLSWNAVVGPGASFTVQVRASNSPIPSGPWTVVGNNVPFTGVTGQYLQVQVIMQRPAKSDAQVRLCDLTICKDVPCATVSEDEVVCNPDGTFYYNFTLTNNTQNNIKYLVLVPPSGVTITPNVIILPAIVPPGGSTTVSLHISGASEGDEICFLMSLLDEQIQHCCGIEVCFTIDCPCIIIVEESIECDLDGTGDYTWTFTILNQSGQPLHHLFLIPQAPAGATFTPNYFNIAITPPWGTATVSTTVSGVLPGQTVNAYIVAFDAQLQECCSLDAEFIAPDCNGEEPGIDDCHLPQIKRCCFPVDNFVVAVLSICNNGVMPASYDWNIKSLAGCAVDLDPASFSPQSGSVVIGPGGCVVIPIQISCLTLYAAGPNLPACISVNVINQTTGQVMKCTGTVTSTPQGVPCFNGPDFVAVPFPNQVQIEFVAAREGKDAIQLVYSAAPPQMVSLNGLPPGEPVIDYLFLPPSTPVGFSFGTRFSEHVQGVHELLLFADLFGDGNLVLATSVALRSTEREPPNPHCLGDLNGDMTVDVLDMLSLFASWGTCQATSGCFADLNYDGLVDVLDMLALFANWGPCPAPPPAPSAADIDRGGRPVESAVRCN